MSVKKSMAQTLVASAITFLAVHTFAGANAIMADNAHISPTKTISNHAFASDAYPVLVLAVTAGPKEDVQGSIPSVSRG